MGNGYSAQVIKTPSTEIVNWSDSRLTKFMRCPRNTFLARRRRFGASGFLENKSKSTETRCPIWSASAVPPTRVKSENDLSFGQSFLAPDVSASRCILHFFYAEYKHRQLQGGESEFAHWYFSQKAPNSLFAVTAHNPSPVRQVTIINRLDDNAPDILFRIDVRCVAPPE